MSLFRGAFFAKRMELSVSGFQIWVELWVPFEETCRTVDTTLGKCGKHCEEEQRICKSCFMILLRFEEISLHCKNIDIAFINFAQLWVAFCQIWGELWASNLNQNGTSPSKIWLS